MSLKTVGIPAKYLEALMVSTKNLEEGGILSLLIKFSVPALVGSLVMSVYNFVSRIYIGRSVGLPGLAAIFVGFPIMMFSMALFAMVGMGATVLISRKLGEKKKDEAERIMGNALTLMLLISVAATVLGLLFTDRLLILFGASPATLPYARGYMQIILMGLSFQSISFGVNNFIRAEGNPGMAMMTTVIGAVCNMILDPIFIFGLDMGVRGAAFAMVISHFVSACWVMSYFLRGKSFLKFRLENLRPRFETIKQILPQGMPMFVTQSLLSVIIGFVNSSLRYYGGDLAISAFGIVQSIMQPLQMSVMGMTQGSQPIIGYNYGARKFERVRQTLQMAITVSTVFVLCVFLVIQLFPAFLAGLFSSDPELVATASRAMRVFMIGLPIISFHIMGAHYFQAIGKPKKALFLNLTRDVVFFLPILLILPRYAGLMGVFWTAPAADILSFMVASSLLYFEMRRLTKKEAAEAEKFAVRESTSL